MLSPTKIISLLQLKPLTFEGGYFRRTYLSDDLLPSEALPERYTRQEKKALASAIYYLLTPDTYSRLHRLPTDELFHFYLGDPVEMLLLDEHGNGEIRILGNDLLAGQRPQILVPKGSWQGSRLAEGGHFALLGTTMSLAFDKADFERPRQLEELQRQYPGDFHTMIEALY